MRRWWRQRRSATQEIPRMTAEELKKLTLFQELSELDSFQHFALALMALGYLKSIGEGESADAFIQAAKEGRKRRREEGEK